MDLVESIDLNLSDPFDVEYQLYHHYLQTKLNTDCSIQYIICYERSMNSGGEYYI